jgi:hypothetical protein
VLLVAVVFSTVVAATVALGAPPAAAAPTWVEVQVATMVND